MNQIFVYTQAVGEIGQSISQTGTEFGELSENFAKIQNKTIQDIKDLKYAYALCLEKFKESETRLSILTAPDILKSTHSELLNTFGQFVKSTEIAIQSLNTENGTVNLEQYQDGMKKQQEASKAIVSITNDMVREINNSISSN